MGAGTSAGDAAKARSATAAEGAADTAEPQSDVPGASDADTTGAKPDTVAGGTAQHRKPDPTQAVAANPDLGTRNAVEPDPVKPGVANVDLGTPNTANPDLGTPDPVMPGAGTPDPATGPVMPGTLTPGGTKETGAAPPAAQSVKRGPLAAQPAVATALPAITEGTVPPEGAGRAATGDAPAPVRQWPLISVLSLTGVGLAVVGVHPFADAFRIGTILIGVALIGAALLRWVLPSVGMLAVRSRFTDLVTYGLLGVVIVLLAMMEQPNPWIEIPFLEDVVHSTVS